MANTKSAEKRMRQSAERRERNRGDRSTMRTAIKKVRGALASGDAQGAQEALKTAVQVIDRTNKKHVVHRNTAARTKSRLAKAVQKAAQK
ncbi:MAG TPA: 30S ribosomal protein S20 [Thermoanaerobaculia bacterium]|jgi:small subunit ribosomal protein S20|nr:30S ribosomal protein S20 [Thermoanaerobaculia bacterium]